MSNNLDLPKCAVLMAAFNGEKWIKEQLESILNQDGVLVSIFISIDRSSDSTMDICQSLDNNDHRVKVLPYGERFFGASKNFYRLVKDVDISSYDIVAFADQDDIWFKDKLVTAYSKIIDNYCDVYSSDVIALWANNSKKLIKKSYQQKDYDHFFEAAGPGCTYVFSREVFLNVKKFIVTNYEACSFIDLHDWLIYAYCREANFKWYIDDNPKMFYRQHACNYFGTNTHFRAYIQRVKRVSNKWYRSQVMAIAKLCDSFPDDKLTRRSFMIRHFRQLRRRSRDQFALLLMSLLGIF